MFKKYLKCVRILKQNKLQTFDFCLTNIHHLNQVVGDWRIKLNLYIHTYFDTILTIEQLLIVCSFELCNDDDVHTTMYDYNNVYSEKMYPVVQLRFVYTCCGACTCSYKVGYAIGVEYVIFLRGIRTLSA